jgi:hypothetical protein
MATKTNGPKTTEHTVHTSAGPQKVETTKLTDETDVQPTEAHKNALQPVDTSDTRMFQTGNPAFADGREPLTKDEARSRGFHWLDTDEDEKSKSKKG